MVLIWLLDNSLRRKPPHEQAQSLTYVHRSPKITHTTDTQTAVTHQSHLPLSAVHPPASFSRPCIACSSHAFAGAFPMPNAHRQIAKSLTNKKSLSATPLHVVFDSRPAKTTHNKEIEETAHSRVIRIPHCCCGLDSRITRHLSASLHSLLIMYLCVEIRLHKPYSLRFKPHTAEHATIAFPSRVLPPSALVDSKVISRFFWAGVINLDLEKWDLLKPCSLFGHQVCGEIQT
jgi:hypothetical protein